ncbi:MAG: helix-turn-helix transcriptional regulator [Clostridia bacterium]|nr:helix-turn-helix transcriptional regulator [Clostridia bacterium]
MIYKKIILKTKGDFMKVEILIKQVRLEKNMSLVELSRLTGIDRGHLSRIEREEKEPKISTLIQIAMALKVDIKELYKIIP